MNHSLYQDGILKALPFKRLPCLLEHKEALLGGAVAIAALLGHDLRDLRATRCPAR